MKNNFVWGQDSEVQLFSLKAWVPAKKYRDKLKKLREGMKTMLELRHEKEIRQIKRKRSCSRDPDALNMSVLKSISIIAYWQIKQYQGKTKELKAPQGKSLQERWQLFTRVEAERRKIFDMKDRYPDDEDWSYACDIHGISRSIHDKNQEILADWWRQMKTGNPLAGYTVQRNWEFCIHPGKEDRFLQAFQKFKTRKEDSGWTSGSQSETLIEILGSTEYSRHCAAMRHGERYSELLTACADCVNLISGDIFRQILETDSLKPGMTFEDRSNKDIHLTVSPGFYQLMKDMNILASESLKESEAAAE